MKAAILSTPRAAPGAFFQLEEVPRPQLEAGHVLLRMVACGVCRTDLHIVEGDLPQIKQQLMPGHQIVGEVIEGTTAELPVGTRVGVSWMGGVDGDCWYCRHGLGEPSGPANLYGLPVNGAMPNTPWRWPPEARPIVSWPLPSVRPGWVRKMTHRP